jgi:hypothetical protein
MARWPAATPAPTAMSMCGCGWIRSPPYALVHLKQELEALLSTSVDVVRLREGMNPFLQQRILDEGLPQALVDGGAGASLPCWCQNGLDKWFSMASSDPGLQRLRQEAGRVPLR